MYSFGYFIVPAHDGCTRLDIIRKFECVYLSIFGIKSSFAFMIIVIQSSLAVDNVFIYMYIYGRLNSYTHTIYIYI